MLLPLCCSGPTGQARDGRRGRDRDRAPPEPVGGQADPVRRGEYLVNRVARCVDCHTPRDKDGRLDRTRLLQGAPIWIKPAFEADEWAERAPDITASGKAGKWREEKMVKLLTRNEQEASAPMPVFQMTAEDARAVYAYLRSLPGRRRK